MIVERSEHRLKWYARIVRTGYQAAERQNRLYLWLCVALITTTLFSPSLVPVKAVTVCFFVLSILAMTMSWYTAKQLKESLDILSEIEEYREVVEEALVQAKEAIQIVEAEWSSHEVQLSQMGEQNPFAQAEDRKVLMEELRDSLARSRQRLVQVRDELKSRTDQGIGKRGRPRRPSNDWANEQVRLGRTHQEILPEWLERRRQEDIAAGRLPEEPVDAFDSLKKATRKR